MEHSLGKKNGLMFGAATSHNQQNNNQHIDYYQDTMEDEMLASNKHVRMRSRSINELPSASNNKMQDSELVIGKEINNRINKPWLEIL